MRWMWVAVLWVSACAPIHRYTDGSLSTYVTQPVPELSAPLARTVSLEVIDFNTAGGQRPVLVGDSTGRSYYLLPANVGRGIGDEVNMGEPYAEEHVKKALQVAFANKAKERGDPAMPTSGSLPDGSDTIRRHETAAKEAYARGDYLAGDIHTSAAMNQMRIDASFAKAEAAVGTTFAAIGAVQAAGRQSFERDFERLRGWVLHGSGAVGESAPEGSHLNVFVLKYLDAEAFQLDSRQRLAVYLVLTRADGSQVDVMEGSDFITCLGRCKGVSVPSTGKPFVRETQSEDAQHLFFEAEGVQYLQNSGFDLTSGMYAYLLMKQGLARLERL